MARFDENKNLERARNRVGNRVSDLLIESLASTRSRTVACLAVRNIEALEENFASLSLEQKASQIQ